MLEGLRASPGLCRTITNSSPCSLFCFSSSYLKSSLGENEATALGRHLGKFLEW